VVEFGSRNPGKVTGVGLSCHGRIARENGKGLFEPRHLAALLVNGNKQRGLSAVSGIGLGRSAQVF